MIFEINGIEKGDKLTKGAQTTFNIKISYDSSITTQPENLNKKLTLEINYVQDVGQIIEPDVPVNTYDLTYVSNQYDNDGNNILISFNDISRLVVI